MAYVMAKNMFTCRISCVSASILEMGDDDDDAALHRFTEPTTLTKILSMKLLLQLQLHLQQRGQRMSLAVRRPVSAALAVHFSFFTGQAVDCCCCCCRCRCCIFHTFLIVLGFLLSYSHYLSLSFSSSSASFFSLWLGIFTSAVEQPKITHTQTHHYKHIL